MKLIANTLCRRRYKIQTKIRRWARGSRNKPVIIIAAVIVCAVVFAALFFYHAVPAKKAAAPCVKKVIVGWKKDFVGIAGEGSDGTPEGWRFRGKPGTPKAVFSVEADPGGADSFLRMEADRASGSLITGIDGVDLAKTPMLRWRWRAVKLPKGADGRKRDRDDQAIGIYIGTGSALSNKSVSYRWDTETPKGTEGESAYGLGAVKIKWYTLRSAEDAAGSGWVTEERNLAEDFKRAWGFYPEKIYLAVSCNSQYTDSSAIADLDWIELTSVAAD